MAEAKKASKKEITSIFGLISGVITTYASAINKGGRNVIEKTKPIS